MSSKYELIPTSEQSSPRSLSPAPPYAELYEDEDCDVEHQAPLTPRDREQRECIRAFQADPRFNPPAPSPYARAALLIFCAFLFWLSWTLRKAIWVDTGMGMGKGVEIVDPSY